MFEKIIEHQVGMELAGKGLKRSDLGDFEYLRYKYRMALRLLEELS